MKLSISNLAFKNSDSDIVYALLKKLKIEGLEIAPTKIFPANPYDNIDKAVFWANELKEKYNLVICSIQSIWYGKTEKIFKSQQERNFLIDYTKLAINFASAINCKNLVFGCPKNRNINSPDDYKTAVEFFKTLGDYAHSKNTTVAIEANPAIYNTNFINDTLSALELIKKVNSKGFKLNLDIGTIIENNEDIKILKNNVDLINHIHISEPYLELIKKRELHKDIIYILKNENYNNFISIEMKEQQNIYDIKNTIHYLKDLNT